MGNWCFLQFSNLSHYCYGGGCILKADKYNECLRTRIKRGSPKTHLQRHLILYKSACHKNLSYKEWISLIDKQININLMQIF